MINRRLETISNLLAIVLISFILPTAADFAPHRFEKDNDTGRCWGAMETFNMNMRRSSCQPRDTVVELMAEHTNVAYIPDKVVVKRCQGGFCYGKATCLPTKVREAKFAVRKHNFLAANAMCGNVIIEEHLACQCGCSVMAHHCSERQMYVPHQCLCVCANSMEKKRCAHNPDKEWDPTTCSCTCKETNPICTTGSEWVPSMCQCMRLIMNNEEANDLDIYPSNDYADQQYEENKYV